MMKLDKIVDAMRARRRELIALPLERVYRDLAIAALRELREANAEMLDESDGHINAASNFANMIDAVIGERA